MNSVGWYEACVNHGHLAHGNRGLEASGSPITKFSRPTVTYELLTICNRTLLISQKRENPTRAICAIIILKKLASGLAHAAVIPSMPM